MTINHIFTATPSSAKSRNREGLRSYRQPSALLPTCCATIAFLVGASLCAIGQTVSPTSLFFGNESIGTPSAAKTVTVNNKGKSAISINSVSTNLTDYAETSNCPFSPATLAPGTKCTISVTLTPTEVGTRTGTLTVTDTGTQTVSLSGTGIVDVSAPSSLAFGDQVLNKKSGTKSVTVKNNLPTSLTITAVATNTLDYSITADTCPLSPATLAAGASCKVTIVFTPSILGADNGTLTITDNAGNSPVVSLTGTGVPPVAVAPSSLTFSGQSLGTTSAGQVVTLANNQSSKLTITSVTSSLGDFSFISTCPVTPATLAAGASCSVSVMFSPTATGIRSANLNFADNASNSPQTVSLTGTGLPAALVSIAVTPANSSVIAGTTQQFTATGTYTDNSTQDLTNSVTWASLNPAAATVSATGLETALGGGTTTLSATSGALSGTTILTVTPARSILSRVPERICMIENEASVSIACTLPAGVPAGDGLVIFVTSTTVQTLAAGALQDSEHNSYSVLGTPASGGYGTINAAYSLLTTNLKSGDSITLNVPAADSWGISIYDLGPIQDDQPDVGVTFQNANVGLPGVNNPATGIPGWWTGQTRATTAKSDLCLTALGVGSGGSGDGAPAPITSYLLDGNFLAVGVSQFYAQSDPNYVNGGTLLTAYSEVPAGTPVQSHITGPNANTAPAVLYCFSEGPGTITQTPQFTGNYCTGAATCTINNVTAGNMLIISAHTFSSLPPIPISVTDTFGDVVKFDQINDVTGLGTWHIPSVAESGSPTITVDDANDSSLVIDVMEVSGQASGNPVESLAQSSLASASLASAMLQTSVPNDLLYGWGRASQGTDEGEGLNAVRVAPTAEYAIDPGIGAQTVTILPRPPLPATTVGDQAMAIRPAGTSAPPVTAPRFTGNYSYCQPASSCTINNVVPGDILVVSFLWWGQASDLPVGSDNLGEILVADRNNDTDGNINLALWHVAAVATAGSHTISINNFTQNGPSAVMISEYSAQSSNPIDAVAGANGAGASANISVVTSQGNDWIYVACACPQGIGAADNYAQISSGPTVELRQASSTAGTENVECLAQSSSTWVIQEMAIKH